MTYLSLEILAGGFPVDFFRIASTLDLSRNSKPKYGSSQGRGSSGLPNQMRRTAIEAAAVVGSKANMEGPKANMEGLLQPWQADAGPSCPKALQRGATVQLHVEKQVQADHRLVE